MQDSPDFFSPVQTPPPVLTRPTVDRPEKEAFLHEGKWGGLTASRMLDYVTSTHGITALLAHNHSIETLIPVFLATCLGFVTLFGWHLCRRPSSVNLEPFKSWPRQHTSSPQTLQLPPHVSYTFVRRLQCGGGSIVRIEVLRNGLRHSTELSIVYRRCTKSLASCWHTTFSALLRRHHLNAPALHAPDSRMQCAELIAFAEPRINDEVNATVGAQLRLAWCCGPLSVIVL